MLLPLVYLVAYLAAVLLSRFRRGDWRSMAFMPAIF
jgi:hypothetical protein